MKTLDSAGYTFDPMSSNSVFGNPAPFMDRNSALDTMPRAHDDSALPHLNQPRFQRDMKQGSSEPNYNDNRDPRESVIANNQIQLAIFATVLALALWW